MAMCWYSYNCILVPRSAAQIEADPQHRTTRIIGSLIDEGWMEDGEWEEGRYEDMIVYLEEDAMILDNEPPDNEYDIIIPFGDSREHRYSGVWILDMQNHMIIRINRHRRAQQSFSADRSHGVILTGTETVGPPVPPFVHPTVDLSKPFWEPKIQVDERHRTFMHRVFRDFDFHWRHVLRQNYNSITLRVFARAIIRLCRLDFEVRASDSPSSGVTEDTDSYWLPVDNLPKWKPFDPDFVRVGDVHVVICDSIQNGLSTAKDHAASRQNIAEGSQRRKGNTGERTHYMILSVKHIMLCRATGLGELQHTAPQPLFNGNHDIGPASDLALDYLLWATASTISRIITPLQKLPTELQDIILGYASRGKVAAAKQGSLLGIGTAFSWKDGSQDLMLDGEMKGPYALRPVESQLWFREGKVGVTYLGGE